MSYFDYKVVPAPRRAKRVKGVHGAELFALTLTDAINEQARQGWEYVRAESLPSETPAGWFRRAVAGEETVLVFRRPREQLGPRLAAVAEPAAAPREAPPEAPRPPAAAERGPLSERIVGVTRRDVPTRREPLLAEAESAQPPTPLRPAHRLGPAETP
jgi:hypothetical protein